MLEILKVLAKLSIYKPKINLLCSKVVEYSAKIDRITINKYLQYTTTDLSTISQTQAYKCFIIMNYADCKTTTVTCTFFCDWR